jgi:hypothetical protein
VEALIDRDQLEGGTATLDLIADYFRGRSLPC